MGSNLSEKISIVISIKDSCDNSESIIDCGDTKLKQDCNKILVKLLKKTGI